jgi:peptidyl-tRNA hydrolase
MDGIDEIQAQLVNRFYFLRIGIDRTRNRLLLTM